MQFLLMIYKDSERFATMADRERRGISDACDTWFEQLQRTGEGVAKARLQPATTAATVRRASDRFLVTDGPFAETKEVFAGYVMLECRDRPRAVEVAKTFPGVAAGFTVEVRPVLASADQCPS